MKITCSKRNYAGEVDAYDKTNVESQPVQGAYENGVLPGPGDYDPPEYDDPEEVDEVIEFINVLLDADIVIDEDGDWEYEDDTYPWARNPERHDGDWYSDNYPDVYMCDASGVVENVDELMMDNRMLPQEPGRYHIRGHVNLYYSIIGVYVDTDFYGMDEDNDPIVDKQYYTDGADVYYVKQESTLGQFECEPLDVSASTEISSGTTFSTPKATSNKRYGMYTTAKYDGVTFSIHYNEIDTSPGADPMEMFTTFRAQVSEVHPYDEGNYLSAWLENGVVYYAENGRSPRKRTYYFTAYDMDLENSEWCEVIIEQAIEELRELNKSVQSRIIHN